MELNLARGQDVSAQAFMEGQGITGGRSAPPPLPPLESPETTQDQAGKVTAVFTASPPVSLPASSAATPLESGQMNALPQNPTVLTAFTPPSSPPGSVRNKTRRNAVLGSQPPPPPPPKSPETTQDQAGKVTAVFTASPPVSLPASSAAMSLESGQMNPPPQSPDDKTPGLSVSDTAMAATVLTPSSPQGAGTSGVSIVAKQRRNRREGVSERPPSLATTQDRRRALLEAVAANDTAAISALFRGRSEAARIEELEQRDENGDTLLLRAVKEGNVEVIRALLNDLSEDARLVVLGLRRLDDRGWTPLLLAIVLENEEVIAELLRGLSSKARLKALDQADNEGCTALMFSLRYDFSTILVLLDGLTEDEQKQAFEKQGRGLWSDFTPMDVFLDRRVRGGERTLAYLKSLGAPRSADRYPLSEQGANRLLEKRFGVDSYLCHVPTYVFYQRLNTSLDNFIQQDGEANNPTLAKAKEIFSKTTDYQLMSAEELATRILGGESVVIPTGWSGHATAVVFSNGLVMKCNRGQRVNENKCGIEVLVPSTRPSPQELTKAIELLRRKESMLAYEVDFNQALKLVPSALDASESVFVQRKGQKSDNCQLVSAITAVDALMFALIRGDSAALAEANDSHEKFTALALAEANDSHKKFTAFDRATSLEKNPKWAAEHPIAAEKTRRAAARVRSRAPSAD